MLLLAVFFLPCVLSSFALGQDPEAGLPACCRRLGAHHCAMSMQERAQLATEDKAPAWHTALAQCPYCPASVVAAHVDPHVPVPVFAGFASGFRQADVVRQAQCSLRIARERSRHKRGPPQIL